MKLILLVLLAVGMVTSAKAASGTTAITISGVVTENKDLAVTAPAAIADTALKDGVTDFTLCTFTEISNKKDGYTVTLESQNSGAAGTTFKLVGATTAEEVSYTLKYGEAAVSLVAGEALVTDATEKTPKDGVSKELKISIPANQNPAADSYSDVLTLTLTSK